MGLSNAALTRGMMEKPWGNVREEKVGSGNSKCKGQGARSHFACLGHSREVSVLEVHWVGERSRL